MAFSVNDVIGLYIGGNWRANVLRNFLTDTFDSKLCNWSQWTRRCHAQIEDSAVVNDSGGDLRKFIRVDSCVYEKKTMVRMLSEDCFERRRNS